MKRSSVLLHSKVKKVFYKGSSIKLSFHIHYLCTIWTWTKRAKYITMHSLCIFLCGSFVRRGRSGQVWMISALCVFFLQIDNKIKMIYIILFGIRHFLTVHIVRQTTKFPDMWSSAKVCAQLRGDAAERGRLFLLLWSFIIAIFTCFVKLDYIMDYYTLWNVYLPMYMNMKRLPRGIQINHLIKCIIGSTAVALQDKRLTVNL